ncbi:RNA-guided pseudouridylation complex pseudouridine synthase subunit Cbf5 [Candidatus Woesearchaeota archaeon]|nr:RNA-guided pseudouridylation complex pseudouridine synthase subunit Cbf5 [Candidatus Woesearchaeota archaeon]
MSKSPFEKVKREVLVKKESETDSELGSEPDKRAVPELIDYGIINIDKPEGPTSHEVSAFVQDILKINKSGHSGTLDPNVTGVLPIALGRATRIVQTLLKAGKEYVCIMHVHGDVKEDRLKKVIGGFVGKIKQLPPLKSAVKRVERIREVYYIDILEIDGKDVLFKVGCEAGTYIRKLCDDIGKKLGCGAHMASLRRTKAGPFDEDSLVTLHDLKDAYWYWKNENNEKYLRHCIQPMEAAVSHLPKIWVFDSTVDSLCHGSDLKIPGVSRLENIEKDQLVAVMTLKNELVAVGRAELVYNKILGKDKGIAVRINKVFMKPGTYKRP